MKKRVLFGLTGVFAVGGLALGGYGYLYKDVKSDSAFHKTAITPMELFISNERMMRQIIRYGDQNSLNSFSDTLNQLDQALDGLHTQGFKTEKVHTLIKQYNHDCMAIINTATPYMGVLKQSSQYEKNNEADFLEKLDQIGLYELKEQFKLIEKERLEYIKKPSLELKAAYKSDAGKMKEIITELYLDSTIENSLFAYVDNHLKYFQTIELVYDGVGMEVVERIKTNGYALKTELEFLPSI